jgi:hypothetical protein
MAERLGLDRTVEASNNRICEVRKLRVSDRLVVRVHELTPTSNHVSTCVREQSHFLRQGPFRQPVVVVEEFDKLPSCLS